MIKKIKKSVKKFSLATYVRKMYDYVQEIALKCQNLIQTNYELGLYHWNHFNNSDALLRFRIVLLLSPNHHGALVGISRCLLAKNNKTSARRYLERAVKMDPQDQEVLYLLDLAKGANKTNIIPLSMVRDYFDFCSDDYELEFRSEKGYKPPLALADLVNAHIQNRDKPIILDIGCGIGHAGVAIAKFLPINQLYGVDLSKTMTDRCQNQLWQNQPLYSQVYQMDYYDFVNKTDLKFDVILACLSLHYERDLSDSLTHIKKILADKALFAFAVEKSNNDKIACALNEEKENFCYNLEHVKEQVKKAGLKLIALDHVSIKNEKMAVVCLCGN